MATLRRRSSMPASSTASSTICRACARLALRFALLHEGADAADDLPGALGLARGLAQRGHQVGLVDRIGIDARDHAVAVVGDGRQRLVQLVRHRRGHLAHRHQPAGDLRALGLQRGLLLGAQPRGDVGGDQHLRQAAVGPLQVARAHVEPLLQRCDEDLARVRAGFGELLRRQAGQAVDHVLGVGQVVAQSSEVAGEQRMAAGVGAEPQPVRAVGEQQFALRHRQHRHRRVQAFQHGGEALVRGRQLVADALGLGDVGHRGHPAGLLAARVDQRRDVHARVEQRAVLAHHAHLDAAGRAAAAAAPAAAGGCSRRCGPAASRGRAARGRPAPTSAKPVIAQNAALT